MPGRTFKRQFTDNNKYAEFDKIPYMDALAHVVEEYVYSDKLDDDYFSYNMTEEIPMFDFMTLVAYFISESHKEFGKSTIVGFVEDLKAQYRGGITTTHVEYLENNLFVTSASYELIMGLLWTTYIYQSACCTFFSKNKKFAVVSAMVYGVMVAESRLGKEAFLKGSLSENATSARKTMLNYMVRNEVRNGLKKEDAKEEPSEDSSNLQSRIAELQAELEKLREQVEHFRNKEKGTALGLNQGQAALFGLALANTFDFNYTNKKEELAPMLHKLFGWGQAKLKSCLSTPCDKAERDELANLFKKLCPPLYETIMNWGELPQ